MAVLEVEMSIYKRELFLTELLNTFYHVQKLIVSRLRNQSGLAAGSVGKEMEQP